MTVGLEAAATAAVDQAIEGDEVAFARIVAAFHADMVRVAYVVAGDHDTAQDAVQAAWVIAWKKLADVRDRDHLRSWLVAVAANEARQLLRRQHRRSIRVLPSDPASPTDADPGRGIERVDLVNALGRLKPQDRAILALRYVAGLDATEIGAQLGISPSGTRARFSRLLGRLRKELDDG